MEPKINDSCPLMGFFPDSVLVGFLLLSLQTEPLEKVANIPADGICADFPM